MNINTYRCFLPIVGLLLYILGCGPEGESLLRPTDVPAKVMQSSIAEMKESTNTKQY